MAMQDVKFSFLEWQSYYSVGNPLIDAQHKVLLRLCSKAIRLLSQDDVDSSVQLQSVLGELWGCIKTHFRTEEELLARCGYVLLAEHKKEHQAFQLVFSGLMSSVAAGSYSKETLAAYLSDWWSEHILCSDKQYSMSMQTLKSASLEYCSAGA